MSLGLQVIAAAANHRPIDIKKLVEAALFDRASAVLTEGYKIVAAEQYGGLEEGRKRTKSAVAKFNNLDRKKGMPKMKDTKFNKAKDDYKISSSEKRGRSEKSPWSKE